MGGISVWQIAIIVVVVAVLFGGKRLRNLGGDLGASLKGFKKAMKDEEPSNIEHKKDDIESSAKAVEKEESK
ncbi:MAG: twin-arginine translocase TatA/TatE family subunit [Gammaproteobacteria bacterium]|nr:twin-arginine translocase TatA/TatE family subunit [Gammaproteobacteria bacterium]